ncbi:ATP-binding cassette domain-containing protein [soil metagenome]
MSVVTLTALSYRFPASKQDVLRTLNWNVLEGSVNLVVGPSGAGKTTLLQCLNGIIPHFHGGSFGGDATVLGNNTRYTAPRDLAASVGTVFQDPESQFVTGTVEDEIVFTMENLAYDRQTMRLRLEETLDLMGIHQLRQRAISELSGGERQRVALAASLASRPRMLILDEPTSQLDPLAAHDILSAVERLNLDFGMTVVIAEHRLDRVLPFAENIVSIRDTELRSGATQEMLPTLDDVPPLVQFGRFHGWHPIPLTVRDARRQLQTLTDIVPHISQAHASGDRVIRIENVNFSYGNTPALHNVNLDAHAGEVIALVGRNGSGNTTLLKQIIGLLRPGDGRVLLNGESIASQPVQNIASRVGYVPQFPSAILHQESLREELAFTAKSQGKTIDPEIMTERLGIAECLDRHPLDLSGGERQRAALAAICAAEPQVLLLDEPTRGLPGHDKATLARFIREYAAQGKLVFIATHDVEFLVLCANRVLTLAGGELIADGAPAKILSGSLSFSTQMNRLLGGDILTLGDAGVPDSHLS